MRGPGSTRRHRSRGLFAIGLPLLAGACDSPEDPVGPSARSTRAAPASLTTVGGDRQNGPVGLPLAARPAVRVSDASRRPLAGVLVSFDPDPGSGVVVSRVVQTGSDGVARVSWTLGERPGPQRLRASARGLPAVAFTANATAAGGGAPTPGAEAFDIEIRLDTASATPAQLVAFRTAELRWEAVVTGDLPDVRVAQAAGFCGSPGRLDDTVDDLLIIAEIAPIDGVGGVLGSAGPCLIRRGTDIPALGRMKFDTADLAELERTGTLDDVILHEMGHVLGIGSLWELFGLVADASRPDSTPPDPHFVGGGAQAEFERVGGTGYAGPKVPIEDTGGSGTRLSHWRERVFDQELMTGYVNRGANPLSRVTVASLEDMGYEVDPAAADAYRLPPGGAVSAARLADPGARIWLGDDISHDPIFTVDSDGVVRPLPAP